MASAASQAGGADSSRSPSRTSGLQESVNVHRCALLLVPQWQCISSFVFYISLRFLGGQKMTFPFLDFSRLFVCTLYVHVLEVPNNVEKLNMLQFVPTFS